jgi:CheY-like chemotaxis protein
MLRASKSIGPQPTPFASLRGVHVTVREKKNHTILHFATDHPALLLRSRNLKRMGYEVLNSTDGFEAIQLACLDQVDAVVLDQNRNGAEIELVAREIKRYRTDRAHDPARSRSRDSRPQTATDRRAGDERECERAGGRAERCI